MAALTDAVGTRLRIGQGGASAVCSAMRKSPLLLLSTFLCAFGLQAQTEPGAKSSPTPPPNVHDASKPATDKVPPPAGSPGKTEESTDNAAKPQVDKNPPPIERRRERAERARA